MEYLENTLGDVIAVLPKVLLFIVILVVGWIIARVLLNLVGRLLKRVGFDRALDRGGMRRFTGDYEPSQILAKLVYYAVLLIALQMAFGVFGPNPITDIIDSIVAFLPRAAVAIIIVVITVAIASAIKDVITSALGGLSYGRMLGTLAQVFVIGLGVIAALNQVGIATTVTTPVLIALLATIGGVIVVGVGGGLVQPMRDRWERWLARSESELNTVRNRNSLGAQQPGRAGTPQPSYAGQGTGAAADPSQSRPPQESSTGTTEEESPRSGVTREPPSD